MPRPGRSKQNETSSGATVVYEGQLWHMTVQSEKLVANHTGLGSAST